MKQKTVDHGPGTLECGFTSRGELRKVWDKMTPLCDSLRLGEIPAEKIIPSGDQKPSKKDTLWMAFSEVGKNVLEHGGGVGKVTASLDKDRRFIKIVVEDEGRGISTPIHKSLYRPPLGGMELMPALVTLALIETPEDQFAFGWDVPSDMLNPPKQGTKVSLWQVA
jgi:hypothetical protein